MSCIDENVTLQFVSGLLAPATARAVEQHVSGCAECRWLLSAAGAAAVEEHASLADADTARIGPGVPSARRAGEMLNNSYVIQRFIGKGGMGTVYEAAHRRLPRRFALKFLSEGSDAEKTAIVRLRREAQVTSQLAHPHVVEAFDFNYTPDGVPFLVMELLEGSRSPHGCSAKARSRRAAFSSPAKALVGYIYLTNDSLPNPWDSIPSYFDQLVAALR